MEQTMTYYADIGLAQEAFNAHLPEGWDFTRIKEDQPEGVGIDAGIGYCAIQKEMFTLSISAINVNDTFENEQVNRVIEIE